MDGSNWTFHIDKRDNQEPFGTRGCEEKFQLTPMRYIRMEMFGITNTPQFNNPTTASATVSNMTLNADGSIRALNGYGEITGATGERQIRFAAKFTF